MHWTRLLTAPAVALTTAAGLALPALAAEIELPKTLVWTAYNTGTSGYNQACPLSDKLGFLR